ncbi:hypothetical protein PR003_g9580 [Phytophthora rubi]|uniref:C2 domain-containing protein n=1 Tax=Phytophthora rubi TaxID=129364 RepID=A0A6A3MMK1_9STRA|nr:hypothetical protein PR002_g9290 [Phytophthora rubi]KAE9036134.1 hypothetical protein PR001_g8984 [Phytophthora rubi]KAE9342257.1 hypothetical protein PR003_g9580 [Phytophthora rubi]
MASSPFSTLYLCIHSAQNVQMKSRYAYCKTFVANKPMVENTTFAAVSSTRFQSFRTSTVRVDNHQPVWKAKFEIQVHDPRVDVLSVLVKNQKLLCCPIVGVCAITLKNLIGAGLVDHWFALHKGQRQTGHIRLQMLLEKIDNPHQECPPNQLHLPVPSQHEQPNRATLVEDAYWRLNIQKRERRRHRYHEAANQGVDSDNRQVCKTTCTIDNQADAFAGALIYDIDQVRLDSDEEEQLLHPDHSEGSESIQSCSSHGSDKRGSRRYQRNIGESTSARSQMLDVERRDLDDDLYGYHPGSDDECHNCARGRRRESAQQYL